MPVDAAIVRRLLAMVRDKHEILAFYRDMPRKELLAERGRMLAIAHGLQLAIQALIDLALHICSALGHEQLERYRDAADALGRLGVLSADQAHTLQSMIGLRNLLVHGYAEIDEQRLLQLIDNNLGDILALAERIQSELAKRGDL